MDFYKHLKNGSFVIIYFLIGLCFLIGDNPELNRAVLLIAILVIALVQIAHIDPKIEKAIHLPEPAPVKNKITSIQVIYKCNNQFIHEISVVDVLDNGELSDTTVFKRADTSLRWSLEAYLEQRVGRLDTASKIWLESTLEYAASGITVCYIPHPVRIIIEKEETNETA